MCQVELQVFANNAAMLALIERDKGLPHGFPLLVNLHHYLLNQVLVVGVLALGEVFIRVLHLEALQVGVESWIYCL